MKLLARYILKEYIKFFFACLLSLVFIAIVFAAIPELENLDKENGLSLFVDSILSGIPLFVEIVTPISVLLATILTFLSLKRSSEIVAMSAAGFSQGRMVFPILLFGILICTFVYLNQSYLAPLWGADERTSVVKRKSTDSTWRFFKGRLFYVSGISYKTKQIRSNTVFHFGTDHQIKQIDKNSQMSLANDRWTSDKNSSRITLSRGSISRNVEKFDSRMEDQFPVIFQKEIPFPKYTSFSALISEILIKKEGAVNYDYDLFAFFQKLATFAAIFIMILLALPFSLYSHKESNTRAGIVTAVILGLGYFLVDQVFLSMNQSEGFNIAASAFGANILFFILALYLIRLKRA